MTGSFNVGNVTPNTIGSQSAAGSITFSTSAANAAFAGINAGSGFPGTIVISNNLIGGITATGSSTAVSLSGINAQGATGPGTYTISGNTIGSPSVSGSLTNTTNSSVVGIITNPGSGGSTSITGNTIANLSGTSTGAGVTVHGIQTSGANTHNITGNTIRNLSNLSNNTAGSPVSTTGISSGATGISTAGTISGQVIAQNTIHSINTSPATISTGVTLAGIQCVTNANRTIERNFIHSLTTTSTGNSTIHGIFITNGSSTLKNNMIRLGVDAAGNSITSGTLTLNGILSNTMGFSTNNYYFNSIYIGGTGVGTGTSNSYAFRRAANETTDLRNNILVNARSNSAGTGKHYAVAYSGTGFNPPGLTSNNNIFFVSGTGGVLGLYDTIDRTTIQAWRSATGQDASSAFVDPLFVDPTAATPDLHLQASNPAESGGIAIAAVTDDFDGETRSSLTPTDIGADAGNFTSSSGDIYAPVISYPLLTAGSTANRTLTGFATIVDNSGVVSGGASLPRLYFKKSTDADAFAGNTSADNGWKFVTASNASSPYSFTIDYSIINGGGVTAGDVIEYFVVAQDDANNLSSNPAGAGASANPPVQNINAKPGAVNSYNITASIDGTLTVCASGCDYVSLTGALALGGIFADINSKVVTGNIIVSISGDLTEDGTNGLNQVTSNDFPQSNVTIQPDPLGTATMKTISGAVANGMIRLNGADGVTIDGRFSNAGRFLTFRNTDTSNPTITLINDASNNTVRSSIIEGASTTSGIVLLSSGVTTGNDNNTITDNIIRDRSDAVGVPLFLISSFGGPAVAVNNSDNTISNNELFNFTNTGIVIWASFSGNESWTIQGNTIYQTAARISPLRGIDFNSHGTNLITQNTIRDLSTNNSAIGITLNDTSGTTVSRNRIYSSSAFSFTGIEFLSNGLGNVVTVVNNQITIIPTSPGNPQIRGIYDNSGSGSTLNVYYNSVLIDGTATGTSPTWGFLRWFGPSSTLTLRNNIFFNNRTGGGGNHSAAGNRGWNSSFSSNYNVFVGTGTMGSDFMDFGSGPTTAISFAQWQINTGGDANSQAGNPGGNFTTAMFVDPSVGDLHIVPAGNPLVSDTGTPVTGITTDYDNATRNALTPDIGSDEIGAPSAANGTISGRVLDENGVPVAGVVINLRGTQDRKTITDSRGWYYFDSVETTGFYTVTPLRVNYSFSPFNRSFSQLGNHTDAAFTASGGGDLANPLDTPEFFVRQQYVDILGREPDEGGFNYWSNEINRCGSDAACVNARRRDIAAAFFIEQEFQQSGSYIYNLYSGALGRKSRYAEYASDRRQVVGGANLEAEKAAFAIRFVQRADFVQKYQERVTAESFVDALLQTVQQSSGVDLSSQRANLVSNYGSGANMVESRSLVLRRVADNAAFKQAEYNAAFVLTEYFGYLKRDPEPGGYDFWLNVLNNREPGNFRGMVCSFITSTEYQKRFSSVVTHSNAECGR